MPDMDSGGPRELVPKPSLEKETEMYKPTYPSVAIICLRVFPLFSFKYMILSPSSFQAAAVFKKHRFFLVKEKITPDGAY